MQTQPAHPIGSVENALRLLVILRDREEIRVSEASAELGVARSTAHRLLAMLHSYGLVEQGRNRAYRVGPVLAEIGLSALRKVDVRAHIRPLSRAARRRARRDGAPHRPRGHQLPLPRERRGHPCPAHDRPCRHRLSGARDLRRQGAVAELGEQELLDLYPEEQLSGHFRSRTALFEHLDEVRERGYARNRGESEAGIAAVGVVQRTSSGRIAGALAVSAPETRMTEARFAEVLPALQRVCAEAQRRLP